jgi:hypothetical protein
MALEPPFLNPDSQQKAAKGDVHGYRVLGTAVITDRKLAKSSFPLSSRALQKIRA